MTVWGKGVQTWTRSHAEIAGAEKSLQHDETVKPMLKFLVGDFEFAGTVEYQGSREPRGILP
jgi:hypothetical protein